MKLLLLLPLLLVLVVPLSFADHSRITVMPDTGSASSFDDCVDIEYGCYVPGIATVDLGGAIIFSNIDNTAHTFTSGTPTDGPNGIFDTSIVMAGNSYEWVANIEGTIPYFCMIHPWMDGIIVVGDGGILEDIDSKCGAGTVFNEISNSCVLEGSKTFDNVSGEIISLQIEIHELKQDNTSLKLENRQLKQQITSLINEIEQLEDLLINGLKEIYNWMS